MRIKGTNALFIIIKTFPNVKKVYQKYKTKKYSNYIKRETKL